MKYFVLAAALLGAAATPAFAEHHEETADLPMDQNDRAMHVGAGTPLDAELQADVDAMGGTANVSTTVETTVKSMTGGVVDTLTGAASVLTSHTEVTTEVTTEVSPAEHQAH